MTAWTDSNGSSNVLSPDTVPLGTGPPTREELLVYYPAKFTFQQLKTFINSGDLGLLKRDKKLQLRYNAWATGIREEYGSMVNYLVTYRLQWGKQDSLSKLTSRLNKSEPSISVVETTDKMSKPVAALPIPAPGTKGYFTADIPRELVSIIQNDWPYSVPAYVEHTLIWTVLPIFPPLSHLSNKLQARLNQDGLWGFTGVLPSDIASHKEPPSPSLLPTCLPALSEWGVTEDKLIRSEKGTEEEERVVKEMGNEVREFIVNGNWKEREWETAWFVNPPRLQSVPGLAHIHVFARYKDQGEIEQWDAEVGALP